VVQGRAFAFGEAFLAGAAGEYAAFLLGAIPEGHAEVIQAPAAILGALRILTTEAFQIVHSGSSRFQTEGKSG
jgi:hypothetical protein